MSIGRKEAVAVPIAVVLVAAAFAVRWLDLGIVTPLRDATDRQLDIIADTAPVFGWWEAHVGWGTPFAVAIAAAVVLWGPTLARRLPWRALLFTTWGVSAAWAFALAMIDGWQRGFAGRLVATHEYLLEVPGVTDIPEMLRTFSSRILDFAPDSWITHVSGHPPGALLTFVWLDRIGLTGGAWAGALCLLTGSSVAMAVVIAVRVLRDEDTARAAAPFLAVAPTAIWVAVSADGYFAGVGAWGICLLVLASRGLPRSRPAWSLLAGAGAGLLLAWAIFLNYGVGLLALPAVAVLVTAPTWRAVGRTLAVAVPAAVAVVVVFAIFGFWWFDGYQLVQERYWQGIAAERPFQYWGWANLASVVCAIGLGSVAGVARLFDSAELRARSALHIVLLGFLAAILAANLSMLSKAEVERIWLPFTMWLPAAAALLPARSHRWWLAANVIGALALNHLIFTNW